jgi:hypothetical protein
VIVAISAATGACYGALAGLSIAALAAPFRRLHVLSFVIAAVSIWIGYMAFRAARAGYTDRITHRESLFRGMAGAFAALMAMLIVLLLFLPNAQSSIAHALGRPASSFTTGRLLIASALLGFGAAFVARIRIAAK